MSHLQLNTPVYGRHRRPRNTNVSLDQVSIDSDYPVSEITDIEYMRDSPMRTPTRNGPNTWKMTDQQPYSSNNGFNVIRHGTSMHNLSPQRFSPMANKEYRPNILVPEDLDSPRRVRNPRRQQQRTFPIIAEETDTVVAHAPDRRNREKIWSAEEESLDENIDDNKSMSDWLVNKKNRPFIGAFILLLISLVVMCVGVIMSENRKSSNFSPSSTSLNNVKPQENDVIITSATADPTFFPTRKPTPNPTKRPTPSPTRAPTPSPTNAPTRSPTPNPTNQPTATPTDAPTDDPTESPTGSPTIVSSPPTPSLTTSTTGATPETLDQVPTASSILTLSPTSSPIIGQNESNNGQPIELNTFYIMSHIPRTQANEADLVNQLKALPNDDTSFLVHLGGLTPSDSTECAEVTYQLVSELFIEHSPLPLYALPGVEDWPACDSPPQALEYFKKYFVSMETYWRTTVPTLTQRSTVRSENFAIWQSNVLWLGLNMAFGTGTTTNQRIQDNKDWIQENLTKYASKARCVIIFGYSTIGNPIFEMLKNQLKGTGVPLIFFETHKAEFGVSKFVNSVIPNGSWSKFWRVQLGNDANSPPFTLKVTIADEDVPFSPGDLKDSETLLGDIVKFERNVV